jgi:hypothetical protein
MGLPAFAINAPAPLLGVPHAAFNRGIPVSHPFTAG